MKKALIVLGSALAIVACGHVSHSKEYNAARERDPHGTLLIAKNADAVRVTANPEAVRSCKFLGNVKSEGHATRSTWDMQFKTAQLGGNTLFAANTKPGREIIGEAYSCAEQH